MKRGEAADPDELAREILGDCPEGKRDTRGTFRRRQSEGST
jgi:hypothetical protein